MRSQNPLDLRTCIAQIETSILEALRLGYFFRYPEAATLADLSARDAESLPKGSLIFVATEGTCYRWEPASLLPVLPPYVVAPVGFGFPNGRWLRESSALTFGHNFRKPLHSVRTGYARYVGIYQGEDDDQLEKIYGQVPAFLVEFVGENLSSSAYRHGAVYDLTLNFIVHAIASNLREGTDALFGSDVVADSGTPPPPGLYRMVGDAHYLLAGSRLGLEPGVMFCSIDGEVKVIETDLAQRRFRAELPLTVRASAHLTDEDLIENPEVWISREDAGTSGQEPFDLSNYVAEGIKLSPGTGLVGTPSPGIAYIGGKLISVVPPPHTFPANSETYRDLLPSGQIAYRSVPHNATPPPPTSGALRIGVTVTDSGSIVLDEYLCDRSVPSGADPGDPFRAA